MSNKLLVFLAGLLLLSALGSYVYYRRAVASVPVDAWALVPDDAVLVLASRDHPTLVRHLRETQLWDNLAALPYFQQVQENGRLLDSLTNSRNNLLRFLGRKTVLASVHITGPGSFDVLYQVPLNTVREFRQVRAAAEALGRHPRFQVNSRTYHGHVLTDVRERGTGNGVTYFNYRNHLILSSGAGLVEKVIARLEHTGQPSVAADFRNTDFLQLRDVDATLLINYRQLPPFLDLFFRPELRPSAQVLTGLGRNGLLELQLAGNKVLLNGFTNPETSRDALHQRLLREPAQRLGMAEVLSLRTAILLHLGVARPTALHTTRTLPAPDSATATALDSIARQLTDEAALCYLAAPSARQAPARLVLVRCADPARVALALGQLRRARGASPAFERVGSYEIHSLGLPEVPARLLGPLFAGFTGAGAVAQAGNYVAFADDASALRGWLQDVAAGHVWARSPTQVAFLEETQPLARFSIFLDTQNSWNVLLRSLREERRAGLLRNETLFKRFPQLAFQLVPAAPEEGAAGQYFTQLLLRLAGGGYRHPNRLAHPGARRPALSAPPDQSAHAGERGQRPYAGRAGAGQCPGAALPHPGKCGGLVGYAERAAGGADTPAGSGRHTGVCAGHPRQALLLRCPRQAGLALPPQPARFGAGHFPGCGAGGGHSAGPAAGRWGRGQLLFV
ncbi:hypothetical protein LRS06_01220 [Hymenobacter sp. J193]|uniref:hypothetical protein n=1 Tax=Hymenobacter sp. J193 TaxID=2898429 RepID=UPI002150735B|nr:hypothetical protein [Hymenobacter sp. J193]MCR5886414.1 hypothetical protein [Hymenobacter sp. J193]